MTQVRLRGFILIGTLVGNLTGVLSIRLRRINHQATIGLSLVLLVVAFTTPANGDGQDGGANAVGGATQDASDQNAANQSSSAIENQAQTADDETALPMFIVGTKHSPPFAFKNSDGNWTGISIELWRHLADKLNLEFEFEELTLEQMFVGLESHRLGASVAAISVTAERHERFEFCHPHFSTGLGIAVPTNSNTGIWSLFRRVVSTRLSVIVGVMMGIVIVSGLLFWLFERRRNEAMFGGRKRQGIGMGVWWSIVLLLGHKGVIPVSVQGRFVAASAMIASLFLLSLLTGVIASVLTVQQLDVGITHPSELRNVRVVTVGDSTSADYLRRRRISFQTRSTSEEAMQAIVDGEADAIVYDEAMLKYLANDQFAESVQVLPVSFNKQEYAIALPPDSELRKPLNEAMLRYRASDEWDEMIFRYLGQ